MHCRSVLLPPPEALISILISPGFRICSVAVDESDSDKTRTLLVVKPAVYRKIVVDGKTFEGILNGDATAMSIATGKIRGQIFQDKNGNGIMDPEDAAIDASASGPDGLYTVKLYRRSDPLREPIKTTVADSTGKFQFFNIYSDPL